MTAALRALAAMGAGILAAFTVTWISQAFPFELYLGGQAPPGQSAYLAMRWLGLFALFLMWLQVMAGLLLPVSLAASAQQRRDLVGFHTWAGLLTLAAVLLHPALFLAAVAARTHHLRLDFLLPLFDRGYYQFWISVGAVALYLAAAGSLAALLRNRPALRRHWRRLHWLNLGAFGLAALHCWNLGSETRLLGVALPLAVAAAAAGAALVRRLGARAG